MKDEEAEVDAFWKTHEEWMQGSHAMGLEGDDAAAPAGPGESETHRMVVLVVVLPWVRKWVLEERLLS